MLGIDAHYGKHLRTFVQFKSGLESFRIGGPRPIDEKKLDFQNAFLDVATSGETELDQVASRETGAGVWRWASDRCAGRPKRSLELHWIQNTEQGGIVARRRIRGSS